MTFEFEEYVKLTGEESSALVTVNHLINSIYINSKVPNTREICMNILENLALLDEIITYTL